MSIASWVYSRLISLTRTLSLCRSDHRHRSLTRPCGDSLLLLSFLRVRTSAAPFQCQHCDAQGISRAEGIRCVPQHVREAVAMASVATRGALFCGRGLWVKVRVRVRVRPSARPGAVRLLLRGRVCSG